MNNVINRLEDCISDAKETISSVLLHSFTTSSNQCFLEDHKTNIVQIENQFELLKKEFYNQINNDCTAVIRSLKPLVYHSDSEAHSFVENSANASNLITSTDQVEVSMLEMMNPTSSSIIWLDQEANEDIVCESIISGFAKCRLCQKECPELAKTDLSIPNNEDASVLCSSCFQRLVPPLMSMQL